jgi:iron(III) transport system ATP-binding protein
MATIQMDQVTKRFVTQQQPAVDNLSLQVHEGELMVLLGPSGCGKTTSLRMIAGFERPDYGIIKLGDEVVACGQTWAPPERRGVGMVFQDYALFPHLNVAQNIAFGVLRLPRRERFERVQSALATVGLRDYERRYPHELSGGQQQRVALARALAPQPRVLLLDEPFSNLDPELRVALRREVRSIVKKVGITSVLVTHDQSEAFALADRVGVMQEGRLHQVADPQTIYRQPATRFVANFVGRAQFITGVVTNNHIETDLGFFTLQTPMPSGTTAEVLLRPDDLQVKEDAYGNGLVIGREFGGATIRYTIRLQSEQVIDVVQPSFELIPLHSIVRVEVLAQNPSIYPIMALSQHQLNGYAASSYPT